MADTQVTDASAFRQRSLVKQAVLAVVTLGLYAAYWWYDTNRQLDRGTDASCSPALRTVGLFVPIYNLVVVWRTSHDAAAATDQDGVVLFLLFLVFAPAGWYLVQSGINGIAEDSRDGGGADGDDGSA